MGTEKVGSIIYNVKINKFILYLLLPVNLVRMYFGMSYWIPNCAIKFSLQGK